MEKGTVMLQKKLGQTMNIVVFHVMFRNAMINHNICIANFICKAGRTFVLDFSKIEILQITLGN